MRALQGWLKDADHEVFVSEMTSIAGAQRASRKMFG
jgi:hypothetical protein